MTETPAPIDDRAVNVQQTVLHIINTKQDEMFEQFDRLHRRGIHDDDVVAALRHFGEVDLLDQYAEWGDIDLREDDNTTTSPDGVTDPGNNPSDLQMQAALAEARIVEATGDITTVEQLALLNVGVILALKGGGAGQIKGGDWGTYLAVAGSDITSSITRTDDDDNVVIVDAADRRELAYYLPATILGDNK